MSNGFWRTRPPKIVHTMNNPLELTLAIIIIVMYSFIYCVWIWSCGLIVLAVKGRLLRKMWVAYSGHA